MNRLLMDTKCPLIDSVEEFQLQLQCQHSTSMQTGKFCLIPRTQQQRDIDSNLFYETEVIV